MCVAIDGKRCLMSAMKLCGLVNCVRGLEFVTSSKSNRCMSLQIYLAARDMLAWPLQQFIVSGQEMHEWALGCLQYLVSAMPLSSSRIWLRICDHVSFPAGDNWNWLPVDKLRSNQPDPNEQTWLDRLHDSRLKVYCILDWSAASSILLQRHMTSGMSWMRYSFLHQANLPGFISYLCPRFWKKINWDRPTVGPRNLHKKAQLSH